MIMEDLKTGMLVRTKDNRLRLILSSTALAIDNNFGGGCDLSEMSFYDSHKILDSKRIPYTIIEVYAEPKKILKADLNWWIQQERLITVGGAELLWKYETPPIEMTMEEVCKALGKNIKIVK